MVKIYKCFAGILSLLILSVLLLTLYVQHTLPDHFYVAQGESFFINSKLYIKPQEVQAMSGKGAGEGDCYQADLKLFGGIGIKQVEVEVVSRQVVIPCGTPFGLKMFTDGVMVVGMSDLQQDGGTVNPAKDAGIKIGDIILEINGQKVSVNEEVGQLVAQSAGEPVRITLKREDEILAVQLCPVRSDYDNAYRAGIWVRDSSAGIGTMTFYDPNTLCYGGLGHAICDIDTGTIMPLSKGEIAEVEITGVKRGENGLPGELKGTFSSSEAMGTLDINSESGVFGTLNQPIFVGQAIPIALRQEVEVGKATILTTLNGNEPEEFEIEIEKVNVGGNAPTKNMVIHVTDERLIAKTGGIVQGMSGSPILQNGRLVGAVTHVFVNDPTRGYAIFAESMLEQTQEVQQNAA